MQNFARLSAALFTASLLTTQNSGAQHPLETASVSSERPVIQALDLDRIGDGPAPWTSLRALDAEAQFHFVVITDRTGGHREGI